MKDGIQNVLDIATWTGVWAIEFGIKALVYILEHFLSMPIMSCSSFSHSIHVQMFYMFGIIYSDASTNT